MLTIVHIVYYSLISKLILQLFHFIFALGINIKVFLATLVTSGSGNEEESGKSSGKNGGEIHDGLTGVIIDLSPFYMRSGPAEMGDWDFLECYTMNH